jgi:Clp amino terminal domain, pathogenicity island component/Glyoxalase superfamily protein
MSQLPRRPNFEHLKKQAKDRLRELRQRDPAAKLADAQHAIAREYGFSNWAALKAHVESVEQTLDSPASTFERYTERAKRATFFSRYEAGQLGHPSIEPEDLLVGVIQARQGLPSRSFAHAFPSTGQVREDVRARTMVQEPLSLSTIIPFGPDTRRIVGYAAEEADRLQHDDIATAHLLLGILRVEGSVAAAILREKGVSLDTVRDQIADLLDGEITSG